MTGQPYVSRLPDGRYFAIELPEGSADLDPLTGEIILQPTAMHLLDHLRVLLSPLPPNTTSGRLRILLKVLGSNREEMASRLQVEESLIEEWESGRSVPNPEQLSVLENLRQQSVKSGIVLPEQVLSS